MRSTNVIAISGDRTQSKHAKALCLWCALRTAICANGCSVECVKRDSVNRHWMCFRLWRTGNQLVKQNWTQCEEPIPVRYCGSWFDWGSSQCNIVLKPLAAKFATGRLRDSCKCSVLLRSMNFPDWAI